MLSTRHFSLASRTDATGQDAWGWIRWLPHSGHDIVVIFDGSRKPRSLPGAIQLLRYGPARACSYVMVFTMGADGFGYDADPVFRAYLRAKGAADDDVRARSDFDWTVLRPGGLHNEPGTGRVLLAEKTRSDRRMRYNR
jgi:hypothetical protein